MIKFIEDQQYPYGQCVLKNMATIQDLDVVTWVEGQKKRWCCEQCGESHSWYLETCPKCGRAVKNYQTDLK
jgi:hypothetical protein